MRERVPTLRGHRDAGARLGARRARLDDAQIGSPGVPRADPGRLDVDAPFAAKPARIARSERARSAAASGGLDAVLVSSYRSPLLARGDGMSRPAARIVGTKAETSDELLPARLPHPADKRWLAQARQ